MLQISVCNKNDLTRITLATEAITRRCSVKKVLLEIWQNSQENTCVNFTSNYLCQPTPATLLKKRFDTTIFL